MMGSPLVASPSAQFSLTLRVALPGRSGGALARVTAAIARAGGAIVAVDTVDAKGDRTLREITVECWSVEHRGQVITAVQAVKDAQLVEITDRTFEVHRRGKIHTGLNMPVKTRDDLSMAYTPGVARVCTAIAENRQKAFKYTIKANTVAVVSDGTAVLGLGDIGPEAAMPVMEGKAMLFKEFADVDAFPICLNTKDVDEIVETVVRMSPTFGGINLEDISSPRCFEIEQRLKDALDIPVFHDDQHGTAIVTLAALINACRLTGRRMEELAVVMVGAGAAGVAVAKILLDAGLTSDRGVRPLRRDPHRSRRLRGRFDERPEALAGREHESRPARRPAPRSARGHRPVHRPVRAGHHRRSGPAADESGPVRVRDGQPNPRRGRRTRGPTCGSAATGRSDYPNQINNVLAFPGFPRRAGRPRHGDHRGDEARGRPGDSPRGVRRRAGARTTSSPGLQPRRSSRVAAAVARPHAPWTSRLNEIASRTVDRAAIKGLMRVTATGATGTIGRRLPGELRERGDEVTVPCRATKRAGRWRRGGGVEGPQGRRRRSTPWAAATPWSTYSARRSPSAGATT